MSARQDQRSEARAATHGDSERIHDYGRSVAACTFDCYGTLIDWRTGIEQTLGWALRSRGYTGTSRIFPVYDESERVEEAGYAPYREVLAFSAMRTAERLGVKLPALEAEKFAESLPRWPAFPDTVEVLHELGQRRVGRFILSNVDRGLLQGTIRRNHLEVDGFVTAEDVRSYKPAPSHWLTFLRDHPIDRANVLHVAQSLFHDIVPAQRLGLRTVWVNRYDDPQPPDIRPTYTIRNLRELLGLIERSPRD